MECKSPLSINATALQVLKSQGLQVGSRVKVLFKVPSNANWTGSWIDFGMDQAVGKTGVVTDISKISVGNIQIRFEGHALTYYYPALCLKIVEAVPKTKVKLNDEYSAEVCHATKTVTVGCQTITFERVNALARVIKEA